jgi:tetratricopeptide (TPR) repeat protein
MRRPSRAERLVVAAGAVALAACASPSLVRGQGAGVDHARAAELVGRAFDHEDAGRLDSAAVTYRALIALGDRAQGLLGLERVLTLMGRRQELLGAADSVVAAAPRDASGHGVRLRTLLALGRADEARRAFDAWVQVAPTAAEPWRTYARTLLDQGRAAAADSVLERARTALGGAGPVASEIAQVHAALGRWGQAASAWREVLGTSDWMGDAAVFSLRRAPSDQRNAVRTALLVPPVPVAARRAAATLLVSWGQTQQAWEALAPLPKSDTAAAAWRAFGTEAWSAGAPLVAREAFVSALEVTLDAELALDAAEASLDGGDAAIALDLTDVAARAGAAVGGRRAVLRTRAFAMLGRIAEARDAAGQAGDLLSKRAAAASLARGLALQGDLDAAMRTLRDADVRADEDATVAWVALWRGDLAAARAAFRDAGGRAPESARALAFLGRTRADTGTAAGRAFLLAARADTAGAAKQFAYAADRHPDAAPFLRLEAARLAMAARDTAGAVAQWRAISERHRDAVEAPEAGLEWGRVLLAQGRRAEARARLEQVILAYPQSALLPQARRALAQAEGRVP